MWKRIAQLWEDDEHTGRGPCSCPCPTLSSLDVGTPQSRLQSTVKISNVNNMEPVSMIIKKALSMRQTASISASPPSLRSMLMGTAGNRAKTSRRSGRRSGSLLVAGGASGANETWIERKPQYMRGNKFNLHLQVKTNKSL